MSIVGAFIEIPPGHTEPNWFDWENRHSGILRDKGSWGLSVSWLEDLAPPERAQVYLIWEPKVFAVWNEGEEIGEDGEHEDGNLVESTGPENTEEPDESD